eukprot:693074-Alexandrium_andersonii.AAC.1
MGERRSSPRHHGEHDGQQGPHRASPQRGGANGRASATTGRPTTAAAAPHVPRAHQARPRT